MDQDALAQDARLNKNRLDRIQQKINAKGQRGEPHMRQLSENGRAFKKGHYDCEKRNCRRADFWQQVKQACKNSERQGTMQTDNLPGNRIDDSEDKSQAYLTA